GGAAQEEGPPDFGTLFADPAGYAELIARGERVHGVCKSCHTFEAGGANGTGPGLHDVFGRQAATHGGFAYSDAMRAYGQQWNFETLDHFLKSPAGTVRGTKMAFAGVRNTEDRVALIAYLRSISPTQLPLPAPLPPPAAAEGAAPAEGAPSAPAGTDQATPAAPTPGAPG
ncbi:MAG: c-type cytochrome, partial [Caulobacterales bacterium]